MKRAPYQTLFLGVVLGVALWIFPVKFNWVTFQERVEEISPRYGLPEALPILTKSEYVLAYDGKTRSAAWVYEHLTPKTLEKNHSRKSTHFKEEAAIAPHLRSHLKDYKGSGFHIGHLCPSADHCSSLQAMEETFTLANAAPQLPWFNRGFWYKLEKQVRTWAEQHENSYIVTGSLFVPQEIEGLRYVQYQVIGQSDVAVPTHFYKVILFEDGDKLQMKAFLVPHETIPVETSLEEYEVDMETLESLSGILFFSKMDPEEAMRLKKKG